MQSFPDPRCWRSTVTAAVLTHSGHQSILVHCTVYDLMDSVFAQMAMLTVIMQRRPDTEFQSFKTTWGPPGRELRMMDQSKFISGSRTAPRDPSSRSGRRPVSVFHDKRQYKMWDGEEEEEMPPSRGGSLSSKDTNYRVKSIHRGFRSVRTGARTSARSQVEK